MKFKLYHYWRSSSSWRVRWALALKEIPCEYASVNLLLEETESEEHLKRNPMGFVPVLEFLETSPDTPLRYLGESVAILEWLEETYPSVALFPKNPFLKAQMRQLAELINAGTQPLQNPAVAAFHSSNPETQKYWNATWIKKGLSAYENLVKHHAGKFSFGDQITYPDLFLIPQCYNALRNEVRLGEFPIVEGIYHRALETPSCQASAPERFKLCADGYSEA